MEADILNQTFLSMAVGQWLTLAAIWASVSAALGLLNWILERRLSGVARRTENVVDDHFVAVLGATKWFFLVFVGLYVATRIVDVPDFAALVIERLTFLALLLQVVLWVNRLIGFYVKYYKESKLEEDAGAVTTVQAMGFISRLVLYAVVLLLALDNLGVEVTALIASLGIGGIAVALALQNVLGDLFGSLSIVLDKPFVVGDFIIVGEQLGVVENIGLKTTRVRSLSGEQLVFSNSDLLNSRIRNFKRMQERRVPFEIGVTYQTTQEQLAAVPDMLRSIVEAQQNVRFDRAHFKAFGDFALKFEIVYYVLGSDYNLFMDVQQAINLAICKRFEEEGIEFAYPTQTLHVAPVRAEVTSLEAAEDRSNGR